MILPYLAMGRRGRRDEQTWGMGGGECLREETGQSSSLWKKKWRERKRKIKEENITAEAVNRVCSKRGGGNPFADFFSELKTGKEYSITFSNCICKRAGSMLRLVFKNSLLRLGILLKRDHYSIYIKQRTDDYHATCTREEGSSWGQRGFNIHEGWQRRIGANNPILMRFNEDSSVKGYVTSFDKNTNETHPVCCQKTLTHASRDCTRTSKIFAWREKKTIHERGQD